MATLIPLSWETFMESQDTDPLQPMTTMSGVQKPNNNTFSADCDKIKKNNM